MLSDPANAVARKFGLVTVLPEELRPVFTQFGIDLPAMNGEDTFELPIPATYVIDKGGKIRWAHVSTDYTTRAEPSDVVKALDALK